MHHDPWWRKDRQPLKFKTDQEKGLMPQTYKEADEGYWQRCTTLYLRQYVAVANTVLDNCQEQVSISRPRCPNNVIYIVALAWLSSQRRLATHTTDLLCNSPRKIDIYAF